MDMNQENNRVLLCGTMAGAPQYSHSAGGQRFYSFPLQVQRLSGSSDVLNIVLRREQLAAVEVGAQARLRVKGELRSFNNRRGGRSDYLPCICWGSRAREAARWQVGDVVRLEGRFQSRGYLKLREDGLERRVAYEVSAASAALADDPAWDERAPTALV